MRATGGKRSIVGMSLLLAVALIGCQSKPTKVYETKENRQKQTHQALSANTILIDARPAFLNALAHPSGSFNLQWNEFTQREPPYEGYLAKDLFFHARRLARLGIGPDSDVLVLGRGRSGQGEEGRLAWTLRRMGVKNVRFANLETIHWPSTQNEAPQRAEVPIWKPEEDTSLEISRTAALELLKKSQQEVWVLDVRPASDYLKDSDVFAPLGMHVRVMNVPWTEFLNAKGEVPAGLREMLNGMGLNLNESILVLDEQGVKSAGVTLQLRDLGFSKATNWTGGYRELLWTLKSKMNR